MPHYIINPKKGTAVYNPGSTGKGMLSPVLSSDALYNTKVRYEPGHRIRISCFSRPIYNPDGFEQVKSPYSGQVDYRAWNPFTGRMEGYDPLPDFSSPQELCKLLEDENPGPHEPRSDSVKRSIDKAFEIGLSNDFRYFFTLTLDKSKIDRYDKDAIYPKLKNWLANRVQRNKMDYLLFAEYHKQKEDEERPAIHFHALANAEGLQLWDSGLRTKNGQPIYNLPSWKYGFSRAIELDGRPAIVRYVTKYITKENQRILGRFYLSGGKTLKRSLPCEYLNQDYASFEGAEYHIPDAHLSVKYRTYDLGMQEEGEDELLE